MKKESKKWKENYEQLRTLSNDQFQEMKDVNDVQFHIEIIIFKATATTKMMMMNNRRKEKKIMNSWEYFQIVSKNERCIPYWNELLLLYF